MTGVGQIDPLGNASMLFFNLSGELEQVVLANGHQADLEYDDAHRPVTETWNTTPPRVTSYTFNAAGQVTSAVALDSASGSRQVAPPAGCHKRRRRGAATRDVARHRLSTEGASCLGQTNQVVETAHLRAEHQLAEIGERIILATLIVGRIKGFVRGLDLPGSANAICVSLHEVFLEPF